LVTFTFRKKEKKRKMSMNNDPFPKETTIMATSMLEMMPCKSCPRHSIEVWLPKTLSPRVSMAKTSLTFSSKILLIGYPHQDLI